jgi:hypothetical protein
MTTFSETFLQGLGTVSLFPLSSGLSLPLLLIKQPRDLPQDTKSILLFLTFLTLYLFVISIPKTISFFLFPFSFFLFPFSFFLFPFSFFLFPFSFFFFNFSFFLFLFLFHFLFQIILVLCYYKNLNGIRYFIQSLPAHYIRGIQRKGAYGGLATRPPCSYLFYPLSSFFALFSFLCSLLSSLFSLPFFSLSSSFLSLLSSSVFLHPLSSLRSSFSLSSLLFSVFFLLFSLLFSLLIFSFIFFFLEFFK